MKQVEVSILGQVYILGCPEGGESLLDAAVASVDKEMTTIREAGKVKARERIAVLAALNVAYQLAERSLAPPPAPASAATSQTADGLSETELDALLRRVDAALGDDGQLL
jgi:cell division protein ZapA